MRQPAGFLIPDRRCEPGLLPVAEFIVHNVDDDPVQERRKLGFSPEMRECTEHPEENFLRHILQTLAFSGKARERPEHHILMTLHELLEVLQAYETAMCGNCFTVAAPGETNSAAPGLIARRGNKLTTINSDAAEAISIIWAIIPVFAMVTVVVIQRFKTQERLRAIEKGITLPSGP
jgi:hypothetical protein